MSSASNTFEQRTRVHNYSEMAMLKYVRQEACPCKQQTVAQQDIEAAQKLIDGPY